MQKPRLQKAITALVVLVVFAIAYVLVESAEINTFEECESAGSLVRYIRVYDGNGPIEKECVLWSGKRFVKERENIEPVFGDDAEINKSCSTSQDCRLPASYALRSDCPYEMRCVDNKCAVVCPWS